jgi:hypothetical protein
MGRFKNTTVYLGGAVEADTDPSSWRNKIKPKLEELGVEVWDPLKKPHWMVQVDGATQAGWKKDIKAGPKDFPCPRNLIDIWAFNNQIREFCLHLVAQANFLIIKLDKTFTVGTFEELSLARHKPVFIICKDEIPSMWLMDQLGLYQHDKHLYIFPDIPSLMARLRDIDKGGNISKWGNVNQHKWLFMTYKADLVKPKKVEEKNVPPNRKAGGKHTPTIRTRRP